MKMFTRNWGNVFFTLLFGLIVSSISMPVLADPATDYANSTGPLHCVNCHGNPGTGLLSVSQLNMDYPTNGPTTDPTKAGIGGGIGLAAYITAAMPKDAKGNCNAACGQAMAHYLRPQAPVADASQSSSPRSGPAPFTMQFDGSKSNCDNGCNNYAWNFGDSTPNGSGKTVSHTYMKSGTYTAALTVTDAQGLTSLAATLPITVSAVVTPPTAVANVSPKSGAAPLNVQFDASGSSCPNGCTGPLSYAWALSEGGTVFGIKAGNIYADVGTHTVTLTVTDDQGLKSSAAPVTVTIAASTRPPVAKINPITSNVKGAAPLNATFDASQSSCDDGCSTYAWNFGDGTTATTTDTSIGHTYPNPGTYNVTLTVTDLSNKKTATATIQVKVVPAETLTTYVQACQQQLNFTNINIPNMNCFDGDLFDTRAPKNDYLVYKKITDQVDVAVACRWVSGDRTTGTGVSLELLVHNRSNGNTCFFTAKHLPPDKGIAVPVAIISPTDSAASSFWEQPVVVDAGVRCVGCHIEGPYIATPLIAPYLAKYGLLNNGHDTGSSIVSSDFTSFNTSHVKYHAISGTVNGVPGAFSQWDSLKQSYMHPTDSSCSLGCHVVGTLSPQPNSDIAPAGNVLLNPIGELGEINDVLAMPPDGDGSDYRWINLSIPDAGTENETFATAKSASTTLVPKLLSACVDPANISNPGVPGLIEVHAVGSDNEFIVTQPGRFTFLPDRLATFNLKDGLTCLNSDQDVGQPKCSDYSVQYECTTTANVKTWVNWPKHSLSSDGDHEERNGANPCPSGSTATSIQASVVLINGWTYSSVGPNDRLAAFSQYGLTCNNSDQPDNKCSNYVVRFSSCTTPPPTQSSKTLTNESTLLGAKQLTSAANSLVKAQGHNGGWNTQAWTIETIAYTEYVRIRIPNQNVYLNVSSQADPTAVSTATLNTGWTSEMWLIEPVSGSSYVRLKNLWTGKYLTMADPTTITDPTLKDYIPIYSQGRNTGWNTQRWIIGN